MEQSSNLGSIKPAVAIEIMKIPLGQLREDFNALSFENNGN
jgi:hypothetical protein